VVVVVSVKEIPGAMGLSREQLLAIYYKMVLARAVGQRERLLNRMGKAPFAVSGEGQEAAQVGVAFALRPGTDWVVPYYRDIGVALTIGQTPRDLLLGHLSRAEDVSSGGRNMPCHFSDPKLRIVSGSAVVGTQIPHAAGIAFASKLRRLDEVTAVFFGDGATSKGDFHEGLNFAGVHKLPVIFVCEHNSYAISVPWSKQAAVENVAGRASGYGFPGVTVDGNDVLAVYAAAKEAVQRARAGDGPTLIEAKTYRLVPHTSDDDDSRYRSRQEVDEWSRKDPILRFEQWAGEHEVLTSGEAEDMRKRVAQEIDEATEYAEQAPKPEPESALDHVFVQEGRK
jgi:2-oxoisovalerate dehydrogenase E1 component alpha subunit